MNRATVLSSCRTLPVLGPLLRRIARHYREDSIVTIRNGHLAGSQWQRRHRYVSGYWLGIYELPIQDCLARELKPGDVFYDIGANAGFFTLLGSKCVGFEGQVFSFEPLPENVQAIRAQLEVNQVANCTLVDAAVGDQSGSVEFCDGADTSTAHLKEACSRDAGSSTRVVRSVALDDFVTTSPPPDFIKMDIEGAELMAFAGARRLLSGKNPPGILIEFHSESLKRDGYSMLQDYGYRFRSLEGHSLVGIPEERHVLCVPPQHRG